LFYFKYDAVITYVTQTHEAITYRQTSVHP